MANILGLKWIITKLILQIQKGSKTHENENSDKQNTKKLPWRKGMRRLQEPGAERSALGSHR